MEADEYTPTTAEVRGIYAVYGYEGNNFDHPDNHQSMDKGRAEFDRWLKGIKSEVWYEAMNSVEDAYYWRESPYD